MLSKTLTSLLAASVLTYVALSATPAEAFTNGLLIPNYICGPATDKLPKTVGAVLTGIINADSGVIAPAFDFLNKTAVKVDAAVGQQVAQTIATFHNNANDLLPNTNVIYLKFSAKQVTPGKAITIDVFSNNFAPLKNGIQEPTPDGRYALDGAVIYAVDANGNKIGSFTNMGTKNRFSPVVGCGTTGQAVVHNSLLYQDGDNFTMTAAGDPVDTYLGLQWTAPATITGSTVTFMGAAVTDLGFGSHKTVIGVAGVNGAPANPLPAPAGPNPKAFAAFVAAAVTGNCVLTYPGADPILSAAGLATPWVTDMNCPQAKVPSFIQANIIDPATGNVFVYHPLVIDADTQPAVAPVPPQLPSGAIVTLHFGTAGTSLVLADETEGTTLAEANCVFSGGADNSPLGGFAHCNALQYFSAVTTNIKNLNPAPPALGTDVNGMACPTSRSFAIVNQAPSYNVPGKTLMTTKDGLFAQATADNMATLQAANAPFTTVTSSADQGLLHTVNKAIGCKIYMAPDLGDNMNLAPSIALDEIQAQLYQAAPVAKVPMNAPAVLLANGGMDGTGAKMVAFRDGVYQTTVTPATAGNGASFCTDYANVAVPTIAKWVNTMAGQASLNKDIGVDMPTYLSNRFMRSWIALNCPVLANMDSPITCKDVNGAIATTTPAVLCNSVPNFAVKAISSDPVDNQPDAGTVGAAATAAAKSSASTLAVASMTSLVAASLVSAYMQM